MPNEVYKAAVQGLGALVAPKVARRIIDEALRASSRTADDVSVSAMRNLLLTRVKRELEGIFPAHMVGPGLERVAADVANVRSRAGDTGARRGLFRSRRPRGSGDAGGAADRDASRERRWDDADVDRDVDARDHEAPEARAAERGDDEHLNRAVKQSSVYLPAVDLPEALPGGVAAPGLPQAPVPTGLAVPPAMVDHVIRTFADLETVRQIVVIDGMQVTQARGAGLSTDRLAALTVATKGLLARAGGLRVFSLEFDGGVLFLFPTRDGAIVVLTQPKVNIGAVLAARADLEEAA